MRVLHTQTYTTVQTRVASSTTATTLAPVTPSRSGLILYNDSTSVLKLRLGEDVAADVYDFKLAAGGYWEDPYGYVGAVSGMWDTADGAARVCEYL